MKEYSLDLDSIMEDLFMEMEKVQDGNHSHKITIKEQDKRRASITLALRLAPFFEKKMEDETNETI